MFDELMEKIKKDNNEQKLINEALRLGIICKSKLDLNIYSIYKDSVSFDTTRPDKDKNKLFLLENVISKLLENKESNKEKLIFFDKMLCELKLKLDNKK